MDVLNESTQKKCDDAQEILSMIHKDLGCIAYQSGLNAMAIGEYYAAQEFFQSAVKYNDRSQKYSKALTDVNERLIHIRQMYSFS